MKTIKQIRTSLKPMVLLVAGIAVSGAVLADYLIIDLGTLGGTASFASGINNNGDVVGSAYLSGNSAYHAFLYSNGVMNDLGTLGGTNSAATGINNNGQVVGLSKITGDTAYHAFRYSSGAINDLGTFGGTHSDAQGISDSGQVVGTATITGDTESHAFLYSNNAMNSFLNVSNSYAYAINNNGQIVGASGSTLSAFRYNTSTNTVTNLGSLGGSSVARAINNNGQVVGFSYPAGDPAQYQHAFLYSNGLMSDLGTLGGTYSYALGININGDVVGQSRTTDNSLHAFLYSNNAMQDLNDLLPPNSGWVLQQATAINDGGLIVGSGTIDGETHAFLMGPGC